LRAQHERERRATECGGAQRGQPKQTGGQRRDDQGSEREERRLVVRDDPRDSEAKDRDDRRRLPVRFSGEQQRCRYGGGEMMSVDVRHAE
jgi:hypothetical protein